MESSQTTELCLEVESRGAAHTDIRRQVTDICVTHLGLTNQDAERLLSCQGPFFVSAAQEEIQLQAIISDLKALGVLVRPSDESLARRRGTVPTGRTALYSSQYGELLGVRPRRHNRGHVSRGTAPSHQIRSYSRPLLLVCLITAGALSSMLNRTIPLPQPPWAHRETEQSAFMPFSPSEAAPTAVMFRGSNSQRGKRMTFQVSKSGNNYSARFAGEYSSGDATIHRVEGEPFFLHGSEGELIASTPVTIKDQNGDLLSGKAQIRIALSPDGEPRQAHILIEPGTGVGVRDERDASTFAASFDLLP